MKSFVSPEIPSYTTNFTELMSDRYTGTCQNSILLSFIRTHLQAEFYNENNIGSGIIVRVSTYTTHVTLSKSLSFLVSIPVNSGKHHIL